MYVVVKINMRFQRFLSPLFSGGLLEPRDKEGHLGLFFLFYSQREVHEDKNYSISKEKQRQINTPDGFLFLFVFLFFSCGESVPFWGFFSMIPFR